MISRTYDREQLLRYFVGVPMAIELPALPEQDCPGHVATDHDPKVCARCGVHIDDLRPPDDDEVGQ